MELISSSSSSNEEVTISLNLLSSKQKGPPLKKEDIPKNLWTPLIAIQCTNSLLESINKKCEINSTDVLVKKRYDAIYPLEGEKKYVVKLKKKSIFSRTKSAEQKFSSALEKTASKLMFNLELMCTIANLYQGKDERITDLCKGKIIKLEEKFTSVDKFFKELAKTNKNKEIANFVATFSLSVFTSIQEAKTALSRPCQPDPIPKPSPKTNDLELKGQKLQKESIPESLLPPLACMFSANSLFQSIIKRQELNSTDGPIERQASAALNYGKRKKFLTGLAKRPSSVSEEPVQRIFLSALEKMASELKWNLNLLCTIIDPYKTCNPEIVNFCKSKLNSLENSFISADKFFQQLITKSESKEITALVMTFSTSIAKSISQAKIALSVPSAASSSSVFFTKTNSSDEDGTSKETFENSWEIIESDEHPSWETV